MPPSNTPNKFGYIKLEEINKSHLGGIMITDDKGVPLDFKYSEPLKPNSIQQIIYGKSLNAYIKNEVIIKGLLKNLTDMPMLFITDDRVYYENPLFLQRPLIYISYTNLASIGNFGEVKQVKEDEFLIQVFNTEAPLRILFLSYKETMVEKSLNILIEASNNIDILEPIQRLSKALDFICSEKQKV